MFRSYRVIKYWYIYIYIYIYIYMYSFFFFFLRWPILCIFFLLFSFPISRICALTPQFHCLLRSVALVPRIQYRLPRAWVVRYRPWGRRTLNAPSRAFYCFESLKHPFLAHPSRTLHALGAPSIQVGRNGRVVWHGKKKRAGEQRNEGRGENYTRGSMTRSPGVFLGAFWPFHRNRKKLCFLLLFVLPLLIPVVF